MKRFMVCASFILLLLLGSIGQIQAFTTIDTTPNWPGGSVTPFGYPIFSTFGQVITVPTTDDTVLQSFSFHMRLPDTCTFRGYVYAWDGTKATGAALYASPTMATLGSGAFEKIEFKTEGITLAPGAQYALFASVSQETGSGSGNWGINFSDVYSGGAFVYIDNGTNTALWTTTPWNSLPYEDLAFTATFVKPTQKILYWIDYLIGADRMKETLVNIANTYSTSTTTATDLADFENKVAAGGWDLVVLMIQGATYPTPNFNAYVSGGGKAILADWTKDATRGALFGVTYTGNDNQDVITITDDLLSSGVDNPMSLTNPGWPVAFSRGMTRTSGTVAATFPNGNAAIVVGENRQTMVNGFLTDTPTFASDGVGLFENEIVTVLPFKVTSPNGGERAPAGDVVNLTWIPGAAVSFDVDISTNKGSSWKPLVKEYADRIFEWRVPLQKDNMPNSKIRVTAYDSYGVKVSQDVSDNIFTIEVVKLISPNGGEILTPGGTQSIVWKTNGTMGTVASVQLFYTLDGRRWRPITTLAGNPRTYLWTIPTVTAPATKCKVKAVLKSASGGKGKTLGTAISDAFFTIQP